MILVDTCVWSLAFRRVRDAGGRAPVVCTLRRLIEEDEPVGIPGIVLQELLSGLRSDRQAARLETALAGFPCVLATRRHHVTAAALWNRCRAAGKPTGTVDCLIAALCIENRASLLTTDRDFERIAALSPLDLRFT